MKVDNTVSHSLMVQVIIAMDTLAGIHTNVAISMGAAAFAGLSGRCGHIS